MVFAVRFVQAADIQDQLTRGHLVLLSNLAYSAAGEPLNCNTYDVATHAAIELKVCGICGVLCLQPSSSMQAPKRCKVAAVHRLAARTSTQFAVHAAG